MFQYEKKLQYPIKVKNSNPALAKIVISQYGGPYGKQAHSQDGRERPTAVRREW